MPSNPPPAHTTTAAVLDVPPPPGWRRLPGGLYARRHDDLAVLVTLDHDGAEPRVWASASRRGRSEGRTGGLRELGERLHLGRQRVE